VAEKTPRVPTPEAIRERWEGLFQALNHEHDAVCAIVAASYVEHCLRALLRKRFVNCDTAKSLLDPTGGALGLLKNAADLAYSIGAISKGCMQNIVRIGTIRNLFAHSIDETTFASENVAELCNELTDPTSSIYGSELQNHRNRFMVAASLLCTSLMLEGLVAEHIQKRVDWWDSGRGST
jgi:DNA-binding MltR family transcriptional regulator